MWIFGFFFGIWGIYAGISLIKTKDNYGIMKGIIVLVGGTLCAFFSLLELIVRYLLPVVSKWFEG